MTVSGTEYIMVPQGLLQENGMTEGKALLCGLIHGLSGKFGYCSAKNDYLANYFNIKESAMKKRILRLIEDDFIVNIGTKKERKLVLKMFQQTGQIVTSEESKGQIVTQKGQIVTNMDLLLTLYSNNKYIIKVNAFDPNKVKSEKEIRQLLFDYFWSTYPNRVKKQDALKKFMTLKVADIEKLINAMPKINAYYTQDDDETSFIPACPHPTTFINGKRWEDEQYLTSKKNTKKGGDIFEDVTKPPANLLVENFVTKLRELSDGDEVAFNEQENNLLAELAWTAEEALEEYYCYQNIDVMTKVIEERLKSKEKVA
ncbi:MAG: Unknown protein [uncultured Sulfurovum sp.]|uniref:Uncharacterized protein n=1 Tax=uncultured Sulfurovum sp. TaxID=269237 RepID=A0A6S6STI7_9BACT|nr:MAG: Unknown protein [uncultured Sulfurovum sp.]